jgi:hypothetical protein
VNKPKLVLMKRRFEEEVVEETTVTTEESTESAPDPHEQFVALLTEMGLSAEQAEAIHQMAMDLIESTGAESSGEEQKVEASRARRGAYGRGGSRRMGHGGSRGGSRRMGGSAPRRRGMSAERRPRRDSGLRRDFRASGRPSRDRMNFGADRMERQLRRQRREIRELRNQLTELGAQPGATRLNTAPQTEKSAPSQVPTQGGPKDRVMAMLKHTF